LFLDEPLTSLNINYQQEFLQIAREFTMADTILVVVIHEINLVVQFADKLFFFKDGEVVAHGKPSAILTEGLIEEVFGVKTTIINHPFSGAPLVVYN
jgi:iron complex transport system ATP-binding protein